MTGIEHITLEFLNALWMRLNEYFQVAIKKSAGSVEAWFESLTPQPRHIDRIHFHLVENRKNESRPFAFLATYTVRIDANGRVRHLPLKSALQEFGEDQVKLLELLATVKKVAKNNTLIATFDASGELFNPI